MAFVVKRCGMDWARSYAGGAAAALSADSCEPRRPHAVTVSCSPSGNRSLCVSVSSRSAMVSPTVTFSVTPVMHSIAPELALRSLGQCVVNGARRMQTSGGVHLAFGYGHEVRESPQWRCSLAESYECAGVAGSRLRDAVPSLLGDLGQAQTRRSAVTFRGNANQRAQPDRRADRRHSAAWTAGFGSLPRAGASHVRPRTGPVRILAA